MPNYSENAHISFYKFLVMYDKHRLLELGLLITAV